MGILDDAIRQHLELKRQHGVPEEELRRQEEEALGPARRDVASAQATDGDADVESDEDRVAEVEQVDAEHEASEAPELHERETRIFEPGEAELEPDLEGPEPRGAEPEPEAAFPEPEPGAAVPEPEPDAALQEPEAESTLPEPEPEAEAEAARSEPEPLAADPGEAAPAAPGAIPDEPPASGALPPEPAPAEPSPTGRTPADGFEALDEDEPTGAEEDEPPAEDEAGGEDVLEDTPDFLQETPEHDRLWFEQRPPRDFDFD